MDVFILNDQWRDSGYFNAQPHFVSDKKEMALWDMIEDNRW